MTALDPCTFVIFGATGNLSRTKLLPALYHLEAAGRLPERCRIVGFGRRPWDDARWAGEVRAAVERREGGLDEEVWGRFAGRLAFVGGDLTDPDSFERLRARLEDGFPANLVLYLAVGPREFGVAADGIARCGLAREDRGWRRLVIEKPFGYDLESAEVLNERLHRHYGEHQLYRIDHYLGKGTIQNILVFRFA
ncbi:MAG TPA: glucose-6-phosphate dehydrogenase, partial [Chromatiales bacterium]|nr:glucose-6-phosphate dehydrogenase [Chromatiales bacterium]